MRDYQVNGQIGQEETIAAFIEKLTIVFRDVRRVLKPKGTFWLIMGNNYKKKNLIGQAWMLALALQSDGWYLRSDIIWEKPNCTPASVKDRPTTSHEYVFLLTKSPRYYYDYDAITEPTKQVSIDRANRGVSNHHKNMKIPGQVPHSMHKARAHGKGYSMPLRRNKRTVWTVSTNGYKGAHFAVFPEKLIEPMVKAGCPPDGIVFDPFMGSGTVALVARNNGRNYLGCELNSDYVILANERLHKQ